MKTKDCGMRIRVERELREDFVQACRAQNRVASDVLREFMRTYVRQQPLGQQSLLLGYGANLDESQ